MDLTPMLAPKSVALIGASNKEGSLGHDLVRMISKGAYAGEVYPINPKYDEICGIKCYPDLPSIGHPVDLAVLCVNAKRVEQQAQLCIDAGAKSLFVTANCVLEEEDVGNVEPKLDKRLIKLCNDNNIPMLGHNAMGFYNNDIDLRVCGFEAPDEGVKGNISLISQSGSVFSTIGHNEPQLKFNLMVATGTGQVTAMEDFGIFALEQPTTKVLGIYMESVRKPGRFIEMLELAARKHIPVVLMKVGKSTLGAKFAQSHTGGLAGDDDAFQAVYDHYGVIRCSSLGEMANTLLMFSTWPEIPAGGVVAIADSGGERNLLADVADEVGLEFAKLNDDTMQRLAAIQEYGQEAANPLDPWGTGIDFEKIFEDSLVTMLSDPNAAVGVISQDLRDGYYLSQGCIDALKGAGEKQSKPVVFMTNFGGTRRGGMTAQIREFACCLTESHAALFALKHWLAFRDFKYRENAVQSLKLEAELVRLLEGKEVLQEKESLAVLSALGVNTLPSWEISCGECLERHKDAYTFPVVLKTAAPGILHKADVGGVKLNLRDYGELKAAYDDMAARLGKEAIVVPMFQFDTELIFGMKIDPNFGPLVIVGAGGIYTEMLRDRIILLPCATEEEIAEKLKTLKTYKLLTGFRGSKPADLDKLVAQIKQFCNLAAYLSQWAKEIDVNPVAVSGDKIVALDALIVCK
ncbi:acetyl-CoA synthetase [Oscillospiraceae bacterium]|nr:acetyl-CoA synthetase [Oscillospiraceae bacterium]BDF76341.1 acetyl-CoA synthetase [Oscillospiraceae bacterium]